MLSGEGNENGEKTTIGLFSKKKNRIGSPFVRFVFGCVSARNVTRPLYCFKKLGFVIIRGH